VFSLYNIVYITYNTLKRKCLAVFNTVTLTNRNSDLALVFSREKKSSRVIFIVYFEPLKLGNYIVVYVRVRARNRTENRVGTVSNETIAGKCIKNAFLKTAKTRRNDKIVRVVAGYVTVADISVIGQRTKAYVFQCLSEDMINRSATCVETYIAAVRDIFM